MKGLEFRLVEAIANKVEMLNYALVELDRSVFEWMNRKFDNYSGNPKIRLYDRIPEIRLQIAAEAIPHTIYSMSDVAARQLNLLHENYNSSFHKIADHLRQGHQATKRFRPQSAPCDWYLKAREIRTEWTHYSASFIGEDNAEGSQSWSCSVIDGRATERNSPTKPSSRSAS